MKTPEYCIIVTSGSFPHIHRFLNDGETPEEGKKRAIQDNIEYIAALADIAAANPDDGYWQDQLRAAQQKEYSVIPYADFANLEREAILNMPLQEITEEQYNDMLDILPPLAWITLDGVTEFCMSEFYTSHYTHQYAKDRRTGKYYSKLVDYRDRSTWIHALLRTN